jgi:hypothetical protein
MIHIIPQHISKGSYTAWYDLLNITEPHIFHQFDDTDEIQHKWIGEPPYNDIFLDKLKKINPKNGDIVIFDSRYINNYDNKLEETLINLSIQYNDCKFVLFDDDNALEYTDTPRYTFFSNKFSVQNKEHLHIYNQNCNYYRYRACKQDYWPYLKYIIRIYQDNIRQKKMNMIIGVDKKERLEIFKYVYNIGLDTDSWLGYSGFSVDYDDSEISKKLLDFRNEKIPVILDTSFERSLVGSVNVELPPLPITMTSYFSCILETMILPDETIHLSEKSWNPFISKNIPLILGSTYINQYLQDIGYWLAGDLFDLTPQKSVSNILTQYRKNLNVINNMSYNEIHSYYIKNQPHIERNFGLLETIPFEFKSTNYQSIQRPKHNLI